MEVLLILTILFSLTAQSPLDVHSQQGIHTNRVENKNWKLRAGFYDDSGAFNDPLMTYRLPNNTRPVRYDIFLKTDIDKEIFEFQGRVRIQIKAVEATDSVTLQSRGLKIDKVSLLDINGNINDEYLNFVHVEPRSLEFLSISLPRPMNVDENFILELTYNGILHPSSAGFYRASFYDGDKLVYYAVTQFESTDARHAFPCYDEPGIRAVFSINIQHAKHYLAYSNMELISESSVTGTDYVISKFNDTPPMQTYILAFLVAPFEDSSNNNVEVPQRIIAKPSSIREGAADFAIALTDPILKKLEDHIGIKYTLSKLDHAAITQFQAGAMENWGLVTYRENVLLFKESGFPEYDESIKKTIIRVMSHEDVHQFFGNLVAPHWWTDLWLNEGLATLYEYYLPHLMYPNDGYMELFRQIELLRCFYIDLPHLSMSVPMSYYVESPKEIESKFDDISYTKSGVVMRMFQEAFGVDTYTKGLRKYLQKMAFKAATPDDLFSSIQEAVNEDGLGNLNVAKIMGSWIYQAGHPTVHVSKRGSNLVFKQQRHMSNKGEIYSVPLSFASKGEPDFEAKTARIWLDHEEMEVPQGSLNLNESDWIIFNIQQTGYYRMSYSSELWSLIAAGLRENIEKIHPINREVLLTELDIGYTKLEELLISDVFEVLLYLVHENSLEMWNQADQMLSPLPFSLLGTDNYDDFLKYLEFITKQQLEILGLENSDGEDLNRKLLRDVVRYYNCFGLGDLCLKHESNNLKLFLESSDYPAPDFCIALRRASMTTFVLFLNDLISNPESRERFGVIRGISCSLDRTQLELLVLIIQDEKNQLQNYERILIIENLLLSSNIGLEIGFEYLERNIEKVTSFQTPLKLAVNTQKYSNKLDNLLNDAIAEGFITLELATSIRESVQSNLKWQSKHSAAARKWFDDLDSKMTTTQKPEPTVEPTTTTEAPDNANSIFGSFIFISTAFVFIKMFG